MEESNARHRRSRSLRHTISRASGVRGRFIHAVQTALQVSLRVAQSWHWASSIQRALTGADARIAFWCSWSLRASRCCFFNAVFEIAVPSVSIGCFSCALRVVPRFFSFAQSRFPAMFESREGLRGVIKKYEKHI